MIPARWAGSARPKCGNLRFASPHELEPKSVGQDLLGKIHSIGIEDAKCTECRFWGDSQLLCRTVEFFLQISFISVMLSETKEGVCFSSAKTVEIPTLVRTSRTFCFNVYLPLFSLGRASQASRTLVTNTTIFTPWPKSLRHKFHKFHYTQKDPVTDPV